MNAVSHAAVICDLEETTWERNSDQGPPNRKRHLEEVNQQEERANKSCQTQPVLLFSSKAELQDFLRCQSFLVDKNDRASQTSQQVPISPLEDGFGHADRLLLLNVHQAVLALSANSRSPPPPPPPPSPPPVKIPRNVLRSPSPMILKQEVGDWCNIASDSLTPPTGTSAAEFVLLESGEAAADPGLRLRPRINKLVCAPCHRIVEITSHRDVRPTAPDEEFRVSPFLCESLLKKSCSVGNFGWRLVCAIYKTDELRDRNYYGNRGKRALSPRRLHAIEHAYYDYLPGEEPIHCLIEGRNAINQGLRNLAHSCISEFSDQSAMWSELNSKM